MALATALIAATTTLSLAPAGPAQARAITPTTYAGQAFRATNHQRVRHDRRILGHHDCLHRFARRQAVRMARQERIFHQHLGRVLRRCHMDFVGENIATGYPSGRATVDRGWMRSPDHRRNILEPRFRRMGLVARRGADGRWYVSQVFGHHR